MLNEDEVKEFEEGVKKARKQIFAGMTQTLAALLGIKDPETRRRLADEFVSDEAPREEE